MKDLEALKKETRDRLVCLGLNEKIAKAVADRLKPVVNCRGEGKIATAGTGKPYIPF